MVCISLIILRSYMLKFKGACAQPALGAVHEYTMSQFKFDFDFGARAGIFSSL